MSIQEVTPAAIKPRLTVPLCSFAALDRLETAVALRVNPELDLDAWKERAPLDAVIGEHRNLADDIDAQVMEHPRSAYQESFRRGIFLEQNERAGRIMIALGTIGITIKTVFLTPDSTGSREFNGSVWYIPRKGNVRSRTPLGIERVIARQITR